MFNKFIHLSFVSIFFLGLLTSQTWGNSSDEAIAKDLVVLFKSARSVFVQNKPLIKNPTGAGIDADKFITLAMANYKKSTGTEFKMDKGNVTAQEMLITAMKGVVHDVVTGKDTDLNPKGYLLPAIFGRKAGVRLGEISNGKVYLKITTRDAYIMHHANKADEWEKGIIGGKFLSKDWGKGKTYSEVVTDGYKKSFRLMYPEYFKESCMKCHGGEYGAQAHAGKVGASVGELGGVISVALNN
ncbi:MAG: c-type heme family protein [Nitrospinales bacterium]